MNVWMTRDEEPDGPLSRALHEAGLSVVHEPVVTRRLINDAGEVIRRLDRNDWLVLTSVFAINAVAAEPARVPRVAVVSEPSRDAALSRGFRVDLVSPGGDGRSLFEALRQRVANGRICYPRSSLAKVPEAWAAVELLCPVLYETVARQFDPTITDRVDVCCVTSPSAVTTILDSDAACEVIRFASIGPTTSAAMRKRGIEPWLESPERSFQALARAIRTGRSA